MATTSLLNKITDQRNATQWVTSWSEAALADPNIYCGFALIGSTTYSYRNRVTFNTKDIIISSSSKLVVEFKIREQEYNCSRLYARLSTTNIAPNTYYDQNYIVSSKVKNATLAESKAFKNSSGSTSIGTDKIPANTSVYFVFDLNNTIQQDETYYIYIAQEGSYTTTKYYTAFDIVGMTLTYESYTACSAPTSVSASGIITQNGSFTVKWSGATAGNANSISGYDIYYLISASGTAPSTSNYTGMVSVGSTVAYKDIKVSGATRGYKVVCGVVTKGSAGPNYYSSIKTGGSVTINTPPNAPTISGSNGIVSSTASISVSASAGSDKDGQTTTVYYNTTNNSSTASKYTQPLTGPSEGASITYYFWTSDGLEFSSVVSRTVTRNSKPTVGISVSGTQVTSINNNSGYPYIISPTITATKGANGQSSNNKYTFKIYYGTSSSSLSSTKTFSAQTDLALSIADIRTHIGVEKYYQIGVIRNDGLENSQETRSGIYYITPIPKVTAVSNKKNNSNGIEPKAYFSKEIYIEAEKDEGYTHIKFNGISSKFTNSGDKMYTTCDVTSLNHGQSYKFIFTLYNSSYTPSATQTWSATLTKILYFQEDLNLTWDGIVNPFNTNEVNLIFRNIFGAIDLNKTVYNKYGFLDAPVYKLIAKYGGKSKTLNFSQTPNTPDNASISVSGNQIYDLFDSLFPGEDKNKNTTYNVEVVLSTVNVFGEVVQGAINKKVNYYGETPILTISSLEFWNGNNNVQLKTEYFKQSMFPKISLECKSYYGKPSEIRLVGKNGETVFYDKNNIDATWTVSGTLGNNSPEIYKTTLIFPSIGVQLEDLKDQEGTKFICSIGLSNLLEDNKTEEFSDSSVGRHTEGKIVINKATYNSNALSLSYLISDFGLSIDDEAPITNKWYTNRLQYKLPGEEEWRNSIYFSNDGENIGTSSITNTQFSADDFNFNFNTEIFKNDDKEYDYITIRLYLTVRSQCNPVDEELAGADKGWGQTTKYVSSNEFIVYNLKPTVAYRKNKLGINHDFSDIDKYTDGILVINSHSGVHTIYLTSSEDVRKIDLSNGQLSNFTINGGTW